MQSYDKKEKLLLYKYLIIVAVNLLILYLLNKFFTTSVN